MLTVVVLFCLFVVIFNSVMSISVSVKGKLPADGPGRLAVRYCLNFSSCFH